MMWKEIEKENAEIDRQMRILLRKNKNLGK